MAYRWSDVVHLLWGEYQQSERFFFLHPFRPTASDSSWWCSFAIMACLCWYSQAMYRSTFLVYEWMVEYLAKPNVRWVFRPIMGTFSVVAWRTISVGIFRCYFFGLVRWWKLRLSFDWRKWVMNDGPDAKQVSAQKKGSHLRLFYWESPQHCAAASFSLICIAVPMSPIWCNLHTFLHIVVALFL